MKPWGPWLWAWALALLFPALALAGAGQRRFPDDALSVEDVPIFGARASWLLWWETERDEFGKHADRGGGPAPAPRGPTADLKKRVSDSLLAATKSPDANLRAAATLALGEMEEATALPRLIELTRDGNAEVGYNAWVSLGLIGTTDARGVLLQPSPIKTSELQTIGWITALGLLENPDDRAFKALRWFIEKQDASPEAQRMAVWALRAQNPDGVRQYLRAIVEGTQNPAAANEAILGLGFQRDVRDVGLLIDIAALTGSAPKLPLFQLLDRQIYPPHTQDENSMVYKRSLAAAARLALGRYGHLQPLQEQQARTFFRDYLLNHVDYDESPWSGDFFYPRLSGLVLAQLGNPDDIDLLIDTVHYRYIDEEQTNRFPSRQKQLTTRGFAAMGLGLFLRQMHDAEVHGQGGIDAPVGQQEVLWRNLRPNNFRRQRDRIRQQLAYSLADRTDITDFRAACALALGLSGDPTNAPLILNAGDKLADQELILGYSVLALGMLDEKRAINAAARYLGPPAKTIDAARALKGQLASGLDIEGVLSRRAAVLGLGILGDPAAEPILLGEWGKDGWVNLEVAKALGGCDCYGGAETWLVLLNQKDAGPLAVSAAASLGALFDPHHPSRLASLVIGNNPSILNAAASTQIGDHGWPYRMVPQLHALGNRYAYGWLIPQHAIWN